jgi:hypothetical protein
MEVQSYPLRNFTTRSVFEFQLHSDNSDLQIQTLCTIREHRNRIDLWEIDQQIPKAFVYGVSCDF